MNRTPEMRLGDWQRKIGKAPELAAPYGLEAAFRLWADRHWPVMRNVNDADRLAQYTEADVDSYALRAFYAGAVTRCPDLNAIYGADVYMRGTLEVQASTITGLKESLAGARRSTVRYMAFAFLGWAAVVVMGVVL